MATSAWFDYNGYMANKLVQLQKADSAAGWDMVKLVKAFADAGFVGDVGAEQHFQAHGQYEDVAPNAFFNATEYYRAKAADFYKYDDPKKVSDLDAVSIQVAIKDAGMSAWSHYEKFGSTEKINPSNSFDTEAYMNAKLTALNSVKDGKQYTLTEVYEAFKAANLSALEHFMIYGGKGDGEVKNGLMDGKIPAEFAVPENKKVVGGGGSEGKTFSLTTETDIFTGDANNNTFIAGKDDTLTAGDQLDGAGGTNTLKLYGNNAAQFGDASIKNIQIVQQYADASLDVSANADVKEVWAMKMSGETITATLDQKIGFGGTGVAETAKFMGTGTAAAIGLSDAGKATAFTSLTVDNTGTAGAAKIEKLTLELSGKNQITELAAESLQELIITGTGSLKAENDNATLGGAGNASKTIKTIDASANTGGVELGLTVANLKTDAVIKGGAGNDKFILDAYITTPMTISGGLGDDTLLVGGTDAMAKPNAKNITGFEYLEFNGAATHDLDAYTGTLDTLKGVIVSDAVTGVSNLQGDALHNVRYTFDSANGGALTGKGFASAVTPSNNKAGIVLDNSVGNHANGVDLATSLTFADVRGLTIESVVGASVLKVDGTLATTSSIADLTATSLTSLTLKGNDSIGIKLAATTDALSEVDASGLTNGAGMYLELTDDTVTTIGVKGSTGNDFVDVDGSTKTVTLNYITNGGHDKIALTTTGSTIDTVNIVQDDATLKGASVAVASDFGSTAVAATGVVKLDLSTALAGTLVVDNVKLGNITNTVKLSEAFTGKGTAITEGGDFAANTNIMFGVNTATLVIQIDVNGDGKFNATDDYQVSIVGTSANSTFGYVAADGDFTFTSAS